MKLLRSILIILLLQNVALSQNTEVNVTSTNGIGVNIENPANYFHIEVPDTYTNDGFFLEINRQDNQDIRAIRGRSVPDIGYGIGGHFTGGYRGVYALGTGASADAGFATYGIYAQATGTAGKRVGIYGQATGGDENLAAEFGPGDVTIQNMVRLNSTNSTGRLTISNTDNIGSYAAALRIYASNNGPETTYGSYVNASNAGTGTAIGYRAIANQSGDFAFWGDGDSYFTGDVRIGQNVNPDSEYRLIVDGKILSEEVRVQNSLDWPDYVFDSDYALMPLPEVESYIDTHHHLPNIPPAATIEEDGIPIGVMQIKLMEKVEELTLHLIAQQKEIETLKQQLNPPSHDK